MLRLLPRSPLPQLILAALLTFTACASADNATTGQLLPAEPITFRIGTGGSAGTYFPIGSIIADAITGANGHHQDSSFYEPDLIALAQRSTGSASNVIDISEGLLEAGLAQADVVHWATTGTGPFDNNAIDNLNSIGTLYLESVHLIVRNESNINSIYDLEGQRVSIDERGSGTQLALEPILGAYEMNFESLNSVFLKPSDAFNRLFKNELDAVFVVAGYPVMAVSEIVAAGKARVVPISGPNFETIFSDFPFFTPDSIPAGTYDNDQDIPTLGVPAQLIINSMVSEELVYNITSMLWTPTTLQMLSRGHPKGKDVQLTNALSGSHTKLHPGSRRFYLEQGILDAH